ncbi:hypothetical protein G6F59_015337 [Rhizopus arrhizus]|nr:hypothetical protein G6F59_015337 [Rhizopus arrhizus]
MARPRLPAACPAARTATRLAGRMGWTRALAAARWRPAAPAGRGGLRTHAAGLPATGTPRALATRAAAADLRWPAVAGRRRRGHRSTFAGLVAGPWGATAVAPGRLVN